MTQFKKYKFSDFVHINPLVKLKPNEKYSFIEMKDLNNGQKFAYPSKRRTLTGGARFEENDILFARITPCLENGKICQAKGLKDEQGFGSTEFLIFRGRKGISDTNFVFYLSRWDEVRRFAELNLVGTSGRQRVPKDVFENLELELPEDLSTQTLIVSILSSLDNKIELNRHTNQTLEQIAQTLFIKYFVDEIDPENLPGGWRWGRLDEEFDITMGQSPEGSSYNETKIGTPFFQGRTDFDFRFPSFRIYTTSPKRFATKFDALLSVRAPVGDLNLALTDCCIGRGIASLRHKKSMLSYGYYKLKTLNYAFETYNGEGTVFGAINKDELAKISVIIPLKKKVEDYDNIVSSIDNKIYQLYQEANSLIQIRDTLLPKLMSGEIEVNIAENELAEQ